MRTLLAFLILTTLGSAQVVFSGTGTSMGTGGVVFTTQTGGGGGGTCTGLNFCASPTGTGTDCSTANPCSLAQLFTNLQGHPGGIASGVLTCPSGNNLYQLPATIVLTSADSGSPGTPTVIQPDIGCNPVISAGVKVPGSWSTDGTITCTGCTTYFIDLATATYGNFEGLWFNGTRRGRIRTTDYSTYLHNSVSNPITVAAGSVPAANTACGCSSSGTNGSPCASLTAVAGTYACANKFIYSGTDVPTGLHGLGLGDVEIVDHEKWTWSRMRLCQGTNVPVTSCQANDISGHIAWLTGPTIASVNQGWLSGHRYLIENIYPKDASANLHSGLWYWDRCPGCASSATAPLATGRLYYIAAAGEDPNASEVIIPQLAHTMTLNGVHDMTFIGLAFEHDNWQVGTYGLGEQQGQPNVSANVTVYHSQRITFQNDTFAHTMGKGIDIQ